MDDVAVSAAINAALAPLAAQIGDVVDGELVWADLKLRVEVADGRLMGLFLIGDRVAATEGPFAARTQRELEAALDRALRSLWVRFHRTVTDDA